MDTIVHLVHCGVKYKCQSVVVNEKKMFLLGKDIA
jgi:hypothetical protein